MDAEFTPEFFDAASAAWRSNKRQVGEGSFKYKDAKMNKIVVPKPRPEPAQEPKMPKTFIYNTRGAAKAARKAGLH